MKPEWLGSVDFVYSNALDHSYDPVLAVNHWMSCVSKRGEGGALFVHHTWQHTKRATSMMDPFGASYTEYIGLLMSAGPYIVVDVLTPPNAGKTDRIFVVKHAPSS